jgi:hypothetical protein
MVSKIKGSKKRQRATDKQVRQPQRGATRGVSAPNLKIDLETKKMVLNGKHLGPFFSIIRFPTHRQPSPPLPYFLRVGFCRRTQ